MKKLYLIILILNSVILVSCLPSRVTYRPVDNPLIINDSVSLTIRNGGLLYMGGFHYSIQFQIDNESYLPVYIDSQDTMISVYGSNMTPYIVNYLSDTIIEHHSGKEVHLAFKGKDISIEPDFFSNRKALKRGHQFVINLRFIIGDSVVRKKIVFKPK